PDLLAEWRLLHAEPLSRARDSTFLSDRNEISKLAQIHCHHPKSIDIACAILCLDRRGNAIQSLKPTTVGLSTSFDECKDVAVKFIRRRFLQLTASAFALPATSPRAWTQSTYPARPVRVIVPFPPGGAGDIFARPIVQKLSERLGKPFYVDNIAGGAG